MTDDLCLLLDPIAGKAAAGHQRVAIAAERVPRDRQENARLVLPDMRHFMDEQPLVSD
jgi:hypothetical protein